MVSMRHRRAHDLESRLGTRLVDQGWPPRSDNSVRPNYSVVEAHRIIKEQAPQTSVTPHPSPERLRLGSPAPKFERRL